MKFELTKTLINQGFSAEKTARANAHFECCTFDHSDNAPDISNVLEFVLELRKFETWRIAENRVK